MSKEYDQHERTDRHFQRFLDRYRKNIYTHRVLIQLVRFIKINLDLSGFNSMSNSASEIRRKISKHSNN